MMAKCSEKRKYPFPEELGECAQRESDGSGEEVSDGPSEMSETDSEVEALFLQDEDVTLDR